MANKETFIASGVKKPNVPTSPFDWSFRNRLTCRFGRVYPVFVKEVPPKSRLKIRPKIAFDMLPMKFPIQSNVRAHLKFYKVPMRILWDKFEDFCSQIGEDGLPITSSRSPLRMPYISRTNWVKQGSLADYMGLPTNVLEELPAFTPTSIRVATTLSASSVDNWVFQPWINSMGTDYRVLHMLLSPANSYLLDNTIASDNQKTFIKFQILSQVDIPHTNATIVIEPQAFLDSEHIVTNYFNPTLITQTTNVRQYSSQRYTLSYAALNSEGLGTYSVRKTTVTINGIDYFRYDYYLRPQQNCMNFLNSLAAQNLKVGLKIESLLMSDWVSDISTSNFNPLTSGIGYYVEENKVEEDLNNYFPIYQGVFSGVVAAARFFNKKAFSSNPSIFDAVNGNVPELPINALPFRAYEFIHNYFNRNVRIDPFRLDGVNQYNNYLTNSGSGADTTEYDFVNALYETDLFTSCLKEPQFGNAPLVGVTLNDMSSTGVLHFEGDGDSSDVDISFDGDGNVLPLSVYPTGTANDPAISRLKDVIAWGISINDLRNVGTFQRALERMQRTDHKFDNVIYEFFGTNPPLGDRYPQLLGGYVEDIHIGKISNTSGSNDSQYKLGEFAGTGYFHGNGRPIKCFCVEPCYVIGILYFSVTPSYPQMLPKHFVKSDVFDYLLNPEFATMGAQPVYRYQIAPLQLSSAELHEVFGYNRPYAEYVSNQDEVHGDFRGDMADFVLTRWFGSKPQLNKSFIEINNEDLTNIFSIQQNEDKIFGEVYFDARATLPLPRSYTARSI